ncbi:WD40 repeat domain-containing protein [Streptomyces sp. NBC_01381]|uniref:WD40 repeat domain-containing protein n=1 Tax=Streptomyces sp. NBC_01381 TaxID=2903845 RepID=UPI002257C187|nr:WD40 repeat domain-containing protein [Streptomyces sp. NBC_01381]
MRSLRTSMGAMAAAAAGCLVLLGAAAPAAADDSHDGFTMKDPRIIESSGLAASRAHPGVYWTHNDQDKGGALLYAVDGKTGETVATITMTGVGKPRDVEAVSVGSDGNLYVGDIGDNLGGTWSHVWIYKLPEPKQLRDQTVRATQYTVKYEDGARDAEALMVHPKTGRIYIADKKEEGGALYEGPAQMSASGVNVFKRLGKTGLWTTDGAFSPDGKQLALRGYLGGVSYAWKGEGKMPAREGRLSVPLQGQGESVSYTLDGTTLMYGTEGEQGEVEPVEVEGAGGTAGSGGGSSGPDAGDGGGAGLDGDFKVGALALAVVVAAFLGLKRVLRRR